MLLAVPFVALLASLLPQPPAPAAPPQTTPAIAWQRNLADALAVQQATGLPLLIAVNMDGEVFNERFATSTYRDPAFIASTAGYVCVVASPDRHTERDYDHRGRRIECPRFPGVTCSEHQTIEPELFRRWFQGRRNAPRHVGVAADGTILFDRYLDSSMQTAIDAIAKHRGTPPSTPPPSDPAALLVSRDAADRRAIEAGYATGDPAARAALLRAVAEAANPQPDLLRQGLRDAPDLAALAALALARTATADQVIDIEDALALELPAAAQEALLSRLATLGSAAPEAARLRAHFAAAPVRLAPPWSRSWAPNPFDPTDRDAIEGALDAAEARLRAGDAAARCDLLLAQLALGYWLIDHRGKHAETWFEDAQRTATTAVDPTRTPHAAAALALARWQLRDLDGARTAATAAMAEATDPAAVPGWLAVRFGAFVVQAAAAAAHTRAAADRTADLSAELATATAWTDLLAERGALDTATGLVAAGLLEAAGLRQRASAALRDLAVRFPAAAMVHERWRNRLWVDRGPDGMRAALAQWAAEHPAAGASAWFAGYGALVAAEQHVRDREPAWASTAYDAALAQFAASAAANPEFADSAHHFAALAHIGRAVLRQEAGDPAGAVTELLAAAALRPASLDERDGLQRQGRDVARRLSAELAAAGRADLADRLTELLR